MKKVTLQKWQALLMQLEAEERLGCIGQDIRTEAELQRFETETSIVLPDGYKEFCQVFGTVIFGDYVTVFCPDISYSVSKINSLKFGLELQVSNEVALDEEAITNLLNSSFVFGDTQKGDYILWGLKTYSDLDKSYDIYLISVNDMDGVYQVGRNFFEFVCDFCLDIKSYQLLPKYRRPLIKDLRRTYTRFSLQ